MGGSRGSGIHARAGSANIASGQRQAPQGGLFVFTSDVVLGRIAGDRNARNEAGVDGRAIPQWMPRTFSRHHLRRAALAKP